MVANIDKTKNSKWLSIELIMWIKLEKIICQLRLTHQHQTWKIDTSFHRLQSYFNVIHQVTSKHGVIKPNKAFNLMSRRIKIC